MSLCFITDELEVISSQFFATSVTDDKRNLPALRTRGREGTEQERSRNRPTQSYKAVENPHTKSSLALSKQRIPPCLLFSSLTE